MNNFPLASKAGGSPDVSITAAEGELLMLLAQARGARRILKIGALGAYSTIWLARGLAEGGSLITLEADPKHAKIARANIAASGYDMVVKLREGLANNSLAQLVQEGAGPFDLIFIDVDKPSYPEYLERALKLSARGTLVITENIIRDGEILNASSDDPRIHGTRRFNELLAAEPRVLATAVQTVGRKGYDGVALAVVVSDA
jgi:predicted O-methyltransferase YrrM